MSKLRSIILLPFLITCVCTFDVLLNAVITEQDFETTFKLLLEECGPQKRKVCFDKNQMVSCYHLTECNNIFAYSSTCDECLSTTSNYWCNIGEQFGNTSSICSNVADFCYYLSMDATTQKSNCPTGSYSILDCNFNGVNDNIEIKKYPYVDTNSNGIIDECEVDCNSNGVYDYIDIQSAVSRDLDDNHVPDECQPDCNGNGIPDELDIIYHTSSDVNRNSVPDECDNRPASPTPSVSPSSAASPSSVVLVEASSSATPNPDLPVESASSSPSPSPTPSPSALPYVTPTQRTCDNVHCFNGGACNTITGLCECQPNWFGSSCEISDCSFNGIYNSFLGECHCYPGWTGDHCDHCATTLDNHLDKIYLCCPAYDDQQKYILVLVPEDMKEDYLNGIFTNKKCEYPNTTFPNRDFLDCSCKMTEGSNNLSEEELELRRSLHNSLGHQHINQISSLRNRLGNIIQDYQGVDTDTYNMAVIGVVGQMMVDELAQNYPIQLGQAMSNNVVSFAEDSSSGENTTGLIIFTVVMVVAVLVGIVMLFVFGVAKSASPTGGNDDEEGRRSNKRISRKHRNL